MKLCKCGCGQKVKIGNVYINGHNRKNQLHTRETKIKISKMIQGHIVTEKTKQKISRGNKGKIHTREQNMQHSERMTGNISWNKNKKMGSQTKEHKEKIGKSNTKITIKYIKEKYKTFAKEEEMRYNPDKPEEKEIQVHCKYHKCKKSKEKGGWFTPTKSQIQARKDALERDDGNDGRYFYCLEKKCKQKCCLFNVHSDPNILSEFKKYNNDVYKETYKTLEKFSNKIKNIELRGVKYGYALDHKYTIYDGFNNNVDPKTISHWKNLEVITISENSKKNRNSSITLEDLLNQINSIC